jgi:hypothetical protein
VDVLCSNLEKSIRLDIELAGLALLGGRRAQRTQDTPAARRRVTECVARLDDLLDMWNEARFRPPGGSRPATTRAIVPA